MLNPLDDVVRHQKAGEAVGVTSICSAHPLVLEAAMLQASDDGSHVLVEATSNQVDQTGGYTGMRPKDFRDLVFETAARCGLSSARVLEGDPNLNGRSSRSTIFRRMVYRGGRLRG